MNNGTFGLTVRMRNRRQLTLGIAFLLIGASLYLLFRSRQHLGFKLIDAIGLGDITDGLRRMVAGVHPPEFVIFALPDGLWTASYILIMAYLFRDHSRRTRICWTSVIPILGLISELLQLAGIVPGTFDIADILCYSLPMVIYIIYELRK